MRSPASPQAFEKVRVIKRLGCSSIQGRIVWSENGKYASSMTASAPCLRGTGDHRAQHVVAEPGAGRLVGLGQQDQLHARRNRLQQSVRVDAEIRVEWDLDRLAAEHPRVDREHRVRRVERDGPVAGTDVAVVQRAHGAVRAGGEPEPLGRYPKARRQLVVERLRVRVLRQLVAVERLADRIHDVIGERRQPLVAIEPDVPVALGAALTQTLDPVERRRWLGKWHLGQLPGFVECHCHGGRWPEPAARGVANAAQDRIPEDAQGRPRQRACRDEPA